MTTTSLKLPEDVKKLAASAAKQQGVTTHAFMVDAIRAAAIAADKRAVMLAEAQAAKDEMLKSGKGYVAEEAHAYLRARVQKKTHARPRAKTWRA